MAQASQTVLSRSEISAIERELKSKIQSEPFAGSRVASWLIVIRRISSKATTSRAEARAVGQQLLDANIFQPIHEDDNDNEFQDSDNAMYCFSSNSNAALTPSPSPSVSANPACSRQTKDDVDSGKRHAFAHHSADIFSWRGTVHSAAEIRSK